MSESLFSTYWYRVKNLKPMLRNTTIISRHVYRGRPWYILKNSLNKRNHRFNAAAYGLIGRMDGRTTVQEIWENAAQLPADAFPTQDELIRLLARLHDADLVQSDILPGTVESVRQFQGAQNNGLKQRVSNPFAFRFPLFDPDRFLEKWLFLTAPLFTRGAFVIWLLAVSGAVIAAIVNGPALSNSLADQLFSMTNLLILWATYPLIKVLHEFGHAFAVKKWGGEVHEIGMMLIALTPIPYVDATASSSFPEKRRRIAVAAMGMMVELLLAAIALFVWLNVETGFISATAYNVMLISGISTVLFNGNPLLRYDGYYILSDLIEIPNLAQRSNRYLGYLARRYLLGMERAESPVTASGEKGWFLVYGPISFCYRVLVMAGLIWLVSGRFFFVGILIALWGAVSLLILPAVRGLAGFLSYPAAGKRRFWVTMTGCGVLSGVVLLVFAFPMPLWTSTQGVVWLPERSIIRAGTDCEIVEVTAPVEQEVRKNELLLKGADPFLKSEIAVCKARLKELYASYNAEPLHQRVKRRMILEEIKRIKEDLRQAEVKEEKLLVRSPARGNFILVDARNLPGRFVKKGELLGYIIAEHLPTVRAVVRQRDIGLVRKRITRVAVRLAEQSTTLLQAQVERIVPAADFNLPSAALGTGGGGDIPVDPTDSAGLRALDRIFQVYISLPKLMKNPHIGGRVYVRFEHGTMPLAMQWFRCLRQIFLRKFYV